MRYLVTVVFIFITHFAIAQVVGNGNVITKTYALQNIEEIEIGLYAEVIIDVAASNESITITADENLMPLIDREVIGDRLSLDQVKWISASKTIKIRINAPRLDFIQQATHETTIVNGLSKSSFSAMANVGTIILHGSVKELRANGEVGTVDATGLSTENVHVNLWSWGSILLDTPSRISGQVKDGGKVIYNGSSTQVDVRTKSDGRVLSTSEVAAADYQKYRYIDVKIKNNSSKRLNAYVRGPKPDGNFFSYGFPMRPNQIRKERWTIGTKVFRKTGLGRKELIELTAEDEGMIVTLF